MRILHIDTGAEMRGGQYQVLLLLDALQNAGHESALLARENSPLWHAAVNAGFAVRAAEARRLWLASKESAIVHAHDARAHTLAAIASRRRFVVSRRVAFAVRRSVASVWKYQRASRFLAVSQFVAKQLEAVGIREEKIDVVHDGVEAVHDLKHWSPDRPVIALASDDPQKGRPLIERAAELARIEVLFSHDLAADLKNASLFVYITHSEGLGSAALLAMSIGVPVIASCVGGLAEVFIDGTSGIFVRNEKDAIASAMRSVLNDRALAQRLAVGGRARIAERFTKEHLLRRTLAAYERALAA